ncbi:MAG TPA: type I-E CRISPR-associated protein Cse2/CasB [Gammaproteobacteria bacterium]|nr:type I-E CRISPR-associated protein Cse2/CasB [Gammaproteobacteria bacterium]
MSIGFSKQSRVGRELADQWSQLQNDRGARAELRRCKSVDEVVMTVVFQRLCHRLRPAFEGQSNWEDRLAAIVGLLSHVEEITTGGSLARQMSMPEGGRPVVSELRFRRLLQRDRTELYTALVRVLRMLKGKADIHDLAHAVFYWGNEIKKKWAYDYFPNVPEKKSA